MTDRSGVLYELATTYCSRESYFRIAELIAAVEDVYAGGNPSCSTPCPSCRIYAALAACRGDVSPSKQETKND